MTDRAATDRAVDVATAAMLVAFTLALLALMAIGIAWLAEKVL